MIQRIQTIYLFLALLVAALGSYFLSLWVNESEESIYAIDKPIVMGAFVLSALLALFTIFLFNNRKLQFVMNRLNIILNFILLGFFVYWSLIIPGEMQISEKGIGMFLPIISIVLLVMANKAIKKDEALVKSVDRLR
ncbi:uncharacterized protein DUF4293 [Mesonia algae]|uniref:Uncharacterized protein DUF4293 n=1 Tax=Mesonia algae TaxID=213248 RepID=A0A2W7JTL8_9FLAO|nr:DUF4293 domain-containing protein [Mesonia algae]PZW38800.1 uncharacterized protein DUF4293 [Mesonia algae]